LKSERYIVIRHRKPIIEMQEVEREILLSFWKVHILHHADEEPIHGQWIVKELRRHGYEISPGTLYPLLGRLVQRGWLDCKSDSQGGKRARKDYRLTAKGRSVLKLIRGQVRELYEEVVVESKETKRKGKTDE
jgi:PadR family transcriptional regulator, regulatory protein PadR